MIAGIGASGQFFPKASFHSPASETGSGTKNHVHGSSADAAGRSEGFNAPAPVRAVEASSTTEKSKNSANPELSEEQERAVQKLKQRDTEVRAHEHAHAAAGGSLAGAPSYQLSSGPDGRQYAIGGEVQIDSAPVRGNPEATIAKMSVVVAAALAPTDPSSQDLQVARQAQQVRAQAQAELNQQRLAESDEAGGDKPSALASGQPQQQSAARQLQAQAAYGGLGDGGDSNREVAAQIFEAAAQLSQIV